MRKNISIHVLCWVAFSTTRMLREAQLDLSLAAWKEMFSFILPTVLIFYLMSGAIAPLLPRRRNGAFVLWSILAMVGYAFVRGEIVQWVNLDVVNKYGKHTLWVNNLWNGFIFAMTGCAYYLVQKYHREELSRQTLQQELLVAELAYLKSQTNPHFLYNSLNFLYAQAIPVSASLSKAILLLSDILRYAVEENDAKGLVSLEKEVRHLENFIAMHRLRFQHKLQLDYQQEVPNELLDQIQIVPFVLISLVENAFKHGLVHQEPLVIRLKCVANNLHFVVKNRIDRQAEKHQTPGVGLKNIRRILDLAYPQRHTLQLLDETDYFTADLVIKCVLP